MTEAATFLLIGRGYWDSQLDDLARRAEAAARRHGKALPGDQTHALAYDQLSRMVEERARGSAGVRQSITASGSLLAGLDRARDGPRHSWIRPDTPLPAVWESVLSPLRATAPRGVVVELRTAFAEGSPDREPVAGPSGSAPRRPEQVWRAHSTGVGAVRERWRGQLEAASRDSSVPLVVRSGISNRVIAPGLREYARRIRGRLEAEIRIVYQDGSEAAPFPVGQLELHERVPEHWPRLRVVLLSARHSEHDIDVDGAWLLNSLISRPRRMAETDALAEEVSREQFEEITRDGPVVIHMYQTGFPPAIMGLYRAVARFLMTRAGDRLALVPYVQRAGRYQPGAPWVL